MEPLYIILVGYFVFNAVFWSIDALLSHYNAVDKHT